MMVFSLCRKERETQWVKTEDQLNENSIVVKGLDPGQVGFGVVIKHGNQMNISSHHQVYSFRVVAVDGEYQTPSRVQVGNLVNLLVIVHLNITNHHRIVQSVNTYLNIAAGHQPQQSTLASSGWFIGMLLAIIFLLGVCLVVCLVKRNRGGKYAVQV